MATEQVARPPIFFRLLYQLGHGYTIKINLNDLCGYISVAELEAIGLSFLLWQHTSVHYSLVALIITTHPAGD